MIYGILPTKIIHTFKKIIIAIHNVKLKINEYDEINLNVLNYISRKSERIAKEIHSHYPDLDFLIVDPLSDLMVAKMLLSTNFPIDQIKGYLGLLSELEMDIVNAISIDFRLICAINGLKK